MATIARAFEQWLRGNALKRREIELRRSGRLGTSFPLVAQTFDAALFDRFAGVGDPSPVPIFILGMPRSGSTLVEQILASHPQVHAAGELTNLDRVVQPVVRRRAAGRFLFRNASRRSTPTSLRRMGQAYLASLPPLADGKTRITDKMPGNFFYVGLIRLILPNARIIHTCAIRSIPAFRVSRRLFAPAMRSATTWPSWAAITADTTS